MTRKERGKERDRAAFVPSRAWFYKGCLPAAGFAFVSAKLLRFVPDFARRAARRRCDSRDRTAPRGFSWEREVSPTSRSPARRGQQPSLNPDMRRIAGADKQVCREGRVSVWTVRLVVSSREGDGSVFRCETLSQPCESGAGGSLAPTNVTSSPWGSNRHGRAPEKLIVNRIDNALSSRRAPSILIRPFRDGTARATRRRRKATVPRIQWRITTVSIGLASLSILEHLKIGDGRRKYRRGHPRPLGKSGVRAVSPAGKRRQTGCNLRLPPRRSRRRVRERVRRARDKQVGNPSHFDERPHGR